jgi:hypothetical protein
MLFREKGWRTGYRPTTVPRIFQNLVTVTFA